MINMIDAHNSSICIPRSLEQSRENPHQANFLSRMLRAVTSAFSSNQSTSNSGVYLESVKRPFTYAVSENFSNAQSELEPADQEPPKSAKKPIDKTVTNTSDDFEDLNLNMFESVSSSPPNLSLGS